MKRESHSMPAANWEALDAIAGSLNCTGPKGAPSWRVLLRRIAVGELRVVMPGTLVTDDALTIAANTVLTRYDKEEDFPTTGTTHYVRDPDAQA